MDHLTSFAMMLTPDYPLWMIGYMCMAYFLAGLIKGVLGMGLPMVLMIMLTLFLPPLEAIPYVLLPMLLTNAFQYWRAPSSGVIARRYAVFAVMTVVTVLLVASSIKTYPESVLLTTIGAAMVLFALNTMFGFPVRIGPNPGWQVLGGVCAGILGGLSSVWAPPVVMYLVGRNVEKEEFIGAVGYLFMAGSISLVITLGTIKLLPLDVALQSMIGLAISLASFRIGEYLRQFLDRDRFSKAVMIAFLIMGTRLVVAGFL